MHTVELRQEYSQKTTLEIQNIKMEHAKKHQKSQYKIKSSDKTVLAEFDQKQALFDSMHESKPFNKHPANKTLYHALKESLIADQNAMDQGTSKDVDPSKKLNSTGSSKGDDLVDDGPAQNWLNDLANAEKPPLSFDDLMSTPIDFSAFAINRLIITKLTKADLVGLVYNLLNETCKSYVELEYNMEECYRALSDQLDSNNPKGNRCPYDLSKPLPLHESRGRCTLPADFFFNNVLEYLREGSIDRKNSASTTKL
ncbi:hypothetical protein Tco_0810652 [Tanacetum coccineum]